MAYKPVGKYPQNFHSNILLRALGEKGVIELYEQYAEHYARTVGTRAPNEKQIRLAHLVREVGTHEAAKRVGVSEKKAAYTVRRVGAYMFLNGNIKA